MQGDWLSLSCPSCRSRFRIRAEYAHLRGRCPECGRRIEPVRPGPEPNRSSDELAPIIEEWPEPPRKEVAEEEASYALGSAAPPVAAEESYGLAPAVETPAVQRDFGLIDDEAPASTSPGPRQPDSPGLVQKLTRAELEPERAPPPPPRPFLDGVYSFPLRKEHLTLSVYLTVEVTVVLFFVWLARFVMGIMDAGSTEGRLMAVGLLLSIASLCILYIALGAHVATAFLHVMEGTSAGNDRIQPMDWIFNEGVGRLVLITWVMLCSAMPGYVAARLMQAPSSLPAMLISGLVLFPVALLSALTGLNPWLIVAGEFIKHGVRRPWVLIQLYVAWLFWLCVVGGSVWAVIGWKWAFLLPIAGPLLGMGILVAARLLGRAALLLTYEPPKTKKAAKEVPAAPAMLNVVVHASTCEFPQKELVAILGKPVAEVQGIPFTEKKVELTQTKYDPSTHALDGGVSPDLVHRFRRGDGARVDFLIKDGRIATALLFNDR